MVLRRYPLYSGAGTLANSSFVTALAGASEECAWCPTQGGDVRASLRDYVGRAAFYCGDLDPKISWVCRKLVSPGDIACDIGANIGIITLLLSKLVGEHGKVYAFEPNPDCCEALNAALIHNRITNVEAHRFALGAVDEERELLIPSKNAGAGSFTRPTDGSEGRALPVSVRTLDQFVSENKIQNIQFIKIDVEGFESEVLKGSIKVLGSLRPGAILFEMNERFDGVLASHPVFKILLDFDYAFLSLPKGLLNVRPRALNPEVVTDLPGHDVIAVPKGECFQRAVLRMNAQA